MRHMCIKVGQYYITRNNPRELLLQNKELQDKIYTLEHPAEQLLRINGFLKDFDKLVEERDIYKERIEKAINYINGAYEMAVYTKSISLDKENIEDLLDILGGDINDR